ncbi:MAG: UDP-N-acetylmuramoyl-L-alanine--D-glutamate ligase [Candidatus Altimarinota bacterium]
MKINQLKGKKVAVIGLGKEGLANLKLLIKAGTAEIGLFDQKGQKELGEELVELANKASSDGGVINWHLGENYLAEVDGYEIILKSPGVSPRQEDIQKALKKGVELTSATKIFLANIKGKVIGISGSKGKSTTSTLIYAFLKKSGKDVELIGNIGNTSLDYLDKDNAEKLYVFELSSYQLEDLGEGQLDVGVLVSFFPDHLDYHAGVENYFEAKMNLTRAVKDNGLLVYNGNNEKIRKFVKEEKIKVQKKIDFLPNDMKEILEKIWDENSTEIKLRGGLVLNREKILLKGKHNLENILAAVEAVREFGVNNENILEVLAEFKGLEHRLEEVGEFKEILFVDDAISTTPESTIAALRSFEKVIGTILLGGMERGYKFDELAKELASKQVKNLILFPETGEKIQKAVVNLGEQNYQPNYFFVSTMQEAVEIAFAKTEKGQICLLSNASPSYNLFKNFEDKGNQFKEMIKKLGNIGFKRFFE